MVIKIYIILSLQTSFFTYASVTVRCCWPKYSSGKNGAIVWQIPYLPASFTFHNSSLSSSGRWRITFAGLLIFNKFNKKLKWRVKDNLCMDIWEYTIIILCEFLIYPCNMQTLFVIKSSGSWILDSQERKLKFNNSQLGTYFNK